MVIALMASSSPLLSRTWHDIFTPRPRLLLFSTPQPLRRTSPCRMVAKPEVPPVSRRSGNYPSTIWNDAYIQSLTSHSTEEHAGRNEELKKGVRGMIHEEKKVVEQLKLVDVLQQLGLAYHFEKEIVDVLMKIHKSLTDVMAGMEGDLYHKSLLFRLLRENGFAISQDVFITFRDGPASFKTNLRHEIKGLLSLYQASYFAMEGENIMDEARDFCVGHLTNLLRGDGDILEPSIKELVEYDLELPLNWRMRRQHTRWFIERCEREDNMHPTLLEFAKLDFNTVQSLYKTELKQLSRWWSDLGLFRDKLRFARDRLVENYFWSVGWAFEPELGRCRKALTMFNCLVTTIDDLYDVYGTLDELELFTSAVKRWEVTGLEQLPEYMKICFLALFNTSNDIAFGILKDKSVDITPYLQRAWEDLCKSYLLEANWYHKGYTPKLEEYLDNAWISISGIVSLTVAYYVHEDITLEDLEHFKTYPNIVRSSSMILRLCDDLATSTDELERGDVHKSIQCYIHEKGVSETIARQHIKDLINIYWKRLNGDGFRPLFGNYTTCSFEKAFKSAAFNIPRMAQCIYQHGDGYGMQANRKTKDHILSLLIEPISF